MDDPQAVGRRFVAALAARDLGALEACFALDVRFRALVPSAVREHDDAADAAGRVALWFGDATELDVLESTVEEVADRLHIAYRVRVREDGELLLVEHQALPRWPTTGSRTCAWSAPGSGRSRLGRETKERLTARPRVSYAPRDDAFRPHLVGLAPRAERERRLLT